jgi:TPR repeat protein
MIGPPAAYKGKRPTHCTALAGESVLPMHSTVPVGSAWLGLALAAHSAHCRRFGFIGGSADSDSETSARGACAALCYELGRGVRADAERAFRLQHLAALQGHIAALNNLGACYARGVGTERNIRKAILCFEAASEAGNAEAAANLRQLRAAGAACSM